MAPQSSPTCPCGRPPWALDVLLAVLSRALFAVHGAVTVWRVVAATGEAKHWLLLTGVALLAVEIAITLRCNRNAEWKWQLPSLPLPGSGPCTPESFPISMNQEHSGITFALGPSLLQAFEFACSVFSPMVFLYLSTVVPSIWFLELNLLQTHLPSNSSTGSDLQILSHIPIVASLTELDPENWVAGLEQTMLMVLVLGRWLMPKGNMSRDQLSQLLMAYVGLGADILDIFDTFREPEVKVNRAVVLAGLGLFTWALMQFPLVLTQSAPPSSRPGPSCDSSEAWSLLLTVGLQDGPFLVYRLYLMACENVLNQLMIFFTCKNILVVLLEIYRILVVQCERKGPMNSGQCSEEIRGGNTDQSGQP